MRISACVIMKNETGNIGTCLASLQGNVDEIVVVDTGSTDNSKEIARQYTDKIYDYVWQDDFAAAKNFALDKASGDWIVFLDADEYFTMATRQNIRPVIEAYNGKADTLRIYLTNVDRDKENLIMDSAYLTRVFLHDDKLCYSGRVHEGVAFVSGGGTEREAYVPLEQLQLYHTGYSSQRIKLKCQRNLALLEAERKINPDKPHLYRYLADAYFGLGDFAKVAEYAELAVKAKVQPRTDASRPYSLWYEALVKIEAPLTKRAKVLELAMRRFPAIPDYVAEYGLLLRSQGKSNKALHYLRKAEKLLAGYNDTTENSHLAGSMDIVRQIMAELTETASRK